MASEQVPVKFDIKNLTRENVRYLDPSDPDVLKQLNIDPFPSYDYVDIDEQFNAYKKYYMKCLLKTKIYEAHREMALEMVREHLLSFSRVNKQNQLNTRNSLSDVNDKLDFEKITTMDIESINPQDPNVLVQLNIEQFPSYDDLNEDEQQNAYKQYYKQCLVKAAIYELHHEKALIS